MATTTTRPATTTTRLATTTSTVSGCDAAVDESIGALGTLLDRFEVGPNFREEARIIFFYLLRQARQECGSDGFGPAASAVVIFLAQEAIERPGAEGDFAQRLLNGVCGGIPDGIDVTLQGRTACLGTNSP